MSPLVGLWEEEDDLEYDQWRTELDSTSLGCTENLYGVFTNNATDCWAVGWNGTIIHTGNGGIYYPIVKLVTNTFTTYLGNEVQFNATITNEVGNCSDFWNWGDGTNTTDTALGTTK